MNNRNERYISGHIVGCRIRAFLDMKVDCNDRKFYEKKLWDYVKQNVPNHADNKCSRRLYDSESLGSAMYEWYEFTYPGLKSERGAAGTGTATQAPDKKGGEND